MRKALDGLPDEENEFLEIADNGPGENSPPKVLERLIDRKLDEIVK